MVIKEKQEERLALEQKLRLKEFEYFTPTPS